MWSQKKFNCFNKYRFHEENKVDEIGYIDFVSRTFASPEKKYRLTAECFAQLKQQK